MEIWCPFCDTRYKITEKDVYVIFGRSGLCFINCKRCGQVVNVDKDINGRQWEK